MFTHALPAAVVLACAAAAPAQVCGLEAEPVPGLGLGPGVSEIVDALAVFEGELYICGGKVMDAGGRAWHATMRWDGSHWSPVGGADSPAADLVLVHDDGSGAGLVVAGDLSGEGVPPELRFIRRWKDGRWEALGDGLQESTGIFELRQVQEEGRDVLYAIGGGLVAGGRPTNVARWNGAEWAPVGDDLPSPAGIWDVEFFQGDLYAADPHPGAVYRLEGEQWVAVPEIPGGAWTLRAYTDSGGERLYLGGVDDVHLGRFDGSNFEPIDLAHLGDHIYDLEVVKEDGRAVLYASGTADGEPRNALYRYDGSEWTVAGLFYGNGYGVQTLAGAEFEGASHLLVGGDFEVVDGVRVQGLALRGPGGWESVGAAAPPEITAIEEAPGAGEAIYISGSGLYDTAGEWLGYAAVLDAGAAQPLGESLPRPANDLHFHNDGAGPVLHAAGYFRIDDRPHAVMRWDGAQWATFGERLDGEAQVLHSFDDGSGHALYLGGFFFDDLRTLSHLARWRSGAWEPVGAPLSGGVPVPRVLALESSAVLGEPRLFAGGIFEGSGTVEDLYGLGWWDPGQSAWLAVPGGPIGQRWGGRVSNLRAVEGPSGATLYAAGLLELPRSGGTFFAAFNGDAWRPIGDPGSRSVVSIPMSGKPFSIFEPLPGREERVIASAADWWTLEITGETIEDVAVFNGETWCDPRTDDVILTSVRSADGSILIGGRLTRFAGANFTGLARLHDSACYADCDGDGELTFFDFLCFQNLFAAMDPLADCDGDTEFTFFDFLCFQNAFAAGCP